MTELLAPLPVVLPLLAAAVTLVLGRHQAAQRTVSVLALVAVVVVAALLLAGTEATGATAVAIGDWPAPQAIVLVVDRVSALMLLVATLVALGVQVYAVGQGAVDTAGQSPVSIFHPTFLVLVAGVGLSFLSGDLFNLYVGFEVLLTASYVLITLGGSAPRIRGGITYVMVSLVGSLVFLAAIALVYAATGTINLAQLSGRLADLPGGTQALLHAMLLIAFGIKAAVFPLSTWLPDSYPTAPAPVTAVFAGLLTKVGIYALIRTETLLFPGPALDTVLMWASLVTMLVGILGAVAQTDIRRMLSFTLVSHIGYMLFGIALGTAAGLNGAVFYVVHHITVQTGLFLVAGLIERRGGSTSVSRLGGLAAASPVLAGLFFLPAMNLAGIPPLSGFLGKLALLEAGIADGGWLAQLVVGVAVLTSLLTLLAVSRVWARAFWRPAGQPVVQDSAAAAAADAGPGDDAGDGSELGTGGPLPEQQDPDRAVREASTSAWRDHVAVATGSDLAGEADRSDDGDRSDGEPSPQDDRQGAAPTVDPLPRPLVLATTAVVALGTALTLVAGPLFGLTQRAAIDLTDRSPYLDAVSAVSGR